jgi:hypothetical protein
MEGIISFSSYFDQGNPSHTQWNLRQVSIPIPGGSFGSIPNQGPWNTVQGSIPIQIMSSNYENQLAL